jgi:hypothetical protein
MNMIVAQCKAGNAQFAKKKATREALTKFAALYDQLAACLNDEAALNEKYGCKDEKECRAQAKHYQDEAAKTRAMASKGK